METDAQSAVRKKPASLVFSVVDGRLFGVDPDTRKEYRIAWCGNGPYSHYVLSKPDDHERGWYVYLYDTLFQSIKDAEMRLIFGAVLCGTCQKDYIRRGADNCFNCHSRERERAKLEHPEYATYLRLKNMFERWT